MGFFALFPVGALGTDAWSVTGLVMYPYGCMLLVNLMACGL